MSPVWCLLLSWLMLIMCACDTLRFLSRKNYNSCRMHLFWFLVFFSTCQSINKQHDIYIVGIVHSHHLDLDLAMQEHETQSSGQLFQVAAELHGGFVNFSGASEATEALVDTIRFVPTKIIANIFLHKARYVSFVCRDPLATIAGDHVAQARLGGNLIELATKGTGELRTIQHLLGRDVTSGWLERFC